ncbi:MAG: virulence-associated E family protein [Tissierellia bacterium]|nr:virulence-associated E family protein [Tissierellia bacterium]
MLFTIAVANSRFQKQRNNKEFSWNDFAKVLSNTIYTNERQDQYFKLSKDEQSKIKDIGGFVTGYLKDGKRSNRNVIYRSMITLDLDFVDIDTNGLFEIIKNRINSTFLIYSTHKHRSEKPRIRLVIPANRQIKPEEYEPIARKIAKKIGIDMFDDSTYEIARLMYFPSTSKDAEYVFKRYDNTFLDVDSILSEYDNWQDVNQWDKSSREKKIIKKSGREKKDPKDLQGIKGAFCRVYTIPEAIDKFIPEKYHQVSQDRYTYFESTTSGGLCMMNEEQSIAYSFHSTDPARNRALNAYEIVAIHKFGPLQKDGEFLNPYKDPIKSAMERLCFKDLEVRKEYTITERNRLKEAFEFKEGEEAKENMINERPQKKSNKINLLTSQEWKELKEQIEKFDPYNTKWFYEELEPVSINKPDELKNSRHNYIKIMNLDPFLKDKLVYDVFANRAIVKVGVPWGVEQIEHDWADSDDSALRTYIERFYGLDSTIKLDDAKNVVFDEHSYNPVKEYLRSLKWDGEKRIDTIFHDYLGAEINDYTQEVARVHFTAAVKRIFEPGCKYDTMVTLTGKQGLGKSTFIQTLGKDWFSASVENVSNGKEASMSLQGFWHIEFRELNPTRKAEREAVKSFLDKTEDIYRIPYAKNTKKFPRQCVFWGTSNDLNFLRDPTGDRRTYPIDCGVHGSKVKKIFDELPDQVDQIWAEAVILYLNGQKTRMTNELLKMAEEEQLAHKEDIPWQGLIEQYLEDEYPENWNDFDLIQRRRYLDGIKDPKFEGRKTKLNKVCIMQIWQEVLGQEPASIKPIDSKNIGDIIRGLDNWEQHKGPLRFGKLYGRQRAFLRKNI